MAISEKRSISTLTVVQYRYEHIIFASIPTASLNSLYIFFASSHETSGFCCSKLAGNGEDVPVAMTR